MVLTSYFRIDTFKVIVVQGVFGAIPWSALGFATMYFQYAGVSDFGASMISACLMGSGVIGSIIARACMFGGIAFLMSTAAVVVKLLGVFIIYTAYKTVMFDDDDEEETELDQLKMVILAVSQKYGFCGEDVVNPETKEIVHIPPPGGAEMDLDSVCAKHSCSFHTRLQQTDAVRVMRC